MPIRLPKGERLVSLLRQSAPGLARPDSCWQTDDGAWIVSIPDTECEKSLVKLGAISAKKPRGAPTRGVVDWLELVDLDSVALPDPWDVATLLVIDDPGVASNLISQILSLGYIGAEIGRLADQPNSPYLIMGTGLPLYVVLGQIHGSGVTVFLDSARRGVWIPAGMSHPLADRIDVPQGHWVLISSHGPWKLLERPKLIQADLLAQFGLETVEKYEVSPWTEPVRISLRMVAADHLAEAVAWLSYEASRPELDLWISQVRPQELTVYHFAVLQMEEPVVLLRLRPGHDALQASLPPTGLALAVVPGLDHVYLPRDRKIAPSVGLVLLRKAFGAQPGFIRILLPKDSEGAFRIISVPDGEGDFQLLTHWVNYVVDGDAALISIWKNSQEFDFDAIIREIQAPAVVADSRKSTSVPILEQDKTPAPSRTGQAIGSIKKIKAASAKSSGQTPVSTGLVVNTPVSPVPSQTSIEPAIDLVAMKLRYGELVEAFWSEQDALYSNRRCELMEEMAAVTLSLGNLAESARFQAVLAWCDPTPTRLNAWFRAEQVTAGVKDIFDIDGCDFIGDLSQAPARQWAVWMAGQTSGQPTESVMDYLREACRSNLWPLRHSWLCAQSLSRSVGGDTLFLAEIRDRLVRRLAGDLRPTGDLPQLMVDRMGQLGVACGEFHGRLIRDVLSAFLEELDQGTTVFGMSGDAKWVVVSLGYAAQAVGLALAGDGMTDGALAKSEQAGKRMTQKPPTFIVLAAESARQAYAFRCDQAKRQVTVKGPLPTDLEPKGRAETRSGANYIYQTFREMSLLLEPDQRINVFAALLKSESASLVRLRQASDHDAVCKAFDSCVDELNELPTNSGQYCYTLLALLERAAGLDEGRATQALSAMQRCQRADSVSRSEIGVERWQLLSAAIRLSCQWNLPIEELLQEAQSEMVALAGSFSFTAVSRFLGQVTRRMLACGRGEAMRDLASVLSASTRSVSDQAAVAIDRERSLLAVEAYLEGVRLTLGLNSNALCWERLMAMDSTRSPYDLNSRMATVGLLDAVVSLGALLDEGQSRQCDALCLRLLKSLAGETNTGGSQILPGCVSGTMRGIEALLAPSGLTTVSVRQAWILDETEASLRARVFREYAQALAGGQET